MRLKSLFAIRTIALLRGIRRESLLNFIVRAGSILTAFQAASINIDLKNLLRRVDMPYVISVSSDDFIDNSCRFLLRKILINT